MTTETKKPGMPFCAVPVAFGFAHLTDEGGSTYSKEEGGVVSHGGRFKNKKRHYQVRYTDTRDTYSSRERETPTAHGSYGASSATRVDVSGELFPPRPEQRSGDWVRGSHLSDGCLGSIPAIGQTNLSFQRGQAAWLAGFEKWWGLGGVKGVPNEGWNKKFGVGTAWARAMGSNSLASRVQGKTMRKETPAGVFPSKTSR